MSRRKTGTTNKQFYKFAKCREKNRPSVKSRNKPIAKISCSFNFKNFSDTSTFFSNTTMIYLYIFNIYSVMYFRKENAY